MDHVRDNKIEQTLIVSDEDNGVLGASQFINTLSDDTQSVYIEARIRFVKHGEFWFEYRHLEYLVTLFLSTRETLVDRPLKKVRTHVDDLGFLFEVVVELKRVELFLVVVLHLLVVGEPQEL